MGAARRAHRGLGLHCRTDRALGHDVLDPVPFDAEAARPFGRVPAAVIAIGRKPRTRVADLMIAATAMAEGLPLFTTNPGDFAGLDDLLRVVPVTRPPVPHWEPGPAPP